MGKGISTFRIGMNLLHLSLMRSGKLFSDSSGDWGLANVSQDKGFLLGAHFTSSHDFAAVVALSLFAVWLDRYRACLLLLKVEWFHLCYFYVKADVNFFSRFILLSNCAVLVVCHFQDLRLCQPLKILIASSWQGWLALVCCYLPRRRNWTSGDTNAAAIILATRL